MVYPTLRAPFAELYTFSALIGSGVGSTTYHVTENATGRTLLLKHISIPTSQKQVQALIYSGAAANEDEAKEYFKNLAEAYRSELELTRPLQGNPAVRLYDDIQIDEKEQEIGYDVYLICTPMMSLGAYLEENAMTQLRAVNLAIDLCTSAEALRTAGLLNYNVKPSNIFLNDAGHFVFGDLGFVRIDELEYSSMPDSQFCSYSAPEFSDLLNHLNLTADIYSIGMILYRIFNGNHGPFVDEQTSPAAAEKMRLSGAPLPAPLYADYELAEILLKACAFRPEERYDSPAALKQALMDYRQRNQIDDLLIVPPIISDPDSLLTQEALEEVVEPVRFLSFRRILWNICRPFRRRRLNHRSCQRHRIHWRRRKRQIPTTRRQRHQRGRCPMSHPLHLMWEHRRSHPVVASEKPSFFLPRLPWLSQWWRRG